MLAHQMTKCNRKLRKNFFFGETISKNAHRVRRFFDDYVS